MDKLGVLGILVPCFVPVCCHRKRPIIRAVGACYRSVQCVGCPGIYYSCLSANGNKSAEGNEHKHTGYGNPAPFIYDCIRYVLWAIGKLRRVNDSPRYLVLRACCIQHRFANDLPDRAAVKVLTEKTKEDQRLIPASNRV